MHDSFVYGLTPQVFVPVAAHIATRPRALYPLLINVSLNSRAHLSFEFMLMLRKSSPGGPLQLLQAHNSQTCFLSCLLACSLSYHSFVFQWTVWPVTGETHAVPHTDRAAHYLRLYITGWFLAHTELRERERERGSGFWKALSWIAGSHGPGQWEFIGNWVTLTKHAAMFNW